MYVSSARRMRSHSLVGLIVPEGKNPLDRSDASGDAQAGQ